MTLHFPADAGFNVVKSARVPLCHRYFSSPMGPPTRDAFAIVSTAAKHPSLSRSTSPKEQAFQSAYGTEHFRKYTDICKFPVETSELQVPGKQTRKRRSTGAMRESEEARKKNAIGPHQHSTRTVARQYADNGMREPQKDSASTTCPAVCSLSPSPAQPGIEIDDSAIWDIEAGINWVRERFSELKTERRHKMETLERQTLRDAIDGNLILCYRCRSFATTDTEGLCADCFHTRCSDCKHPGDLGPDRYVSAEEAKAVE